MPEESPSGRRLLAGLRTAPAARLQRPIQGTPATKSKQIITLILSLCCEVTQYFLLVTLFCTRPSSSAPQGGNASLPNVSSTPFSSAAAIASIAFHQPGADLSDSLRNFKYLFVLSETFFSFFLNNSRTEANGLRCMPPQISNSDNLIVFGWLVLFEPSRHNL